MAVAADVRQGPALLTPRSFQTATLLPDGRVWLAGGVSISPFVVHASTELYDPRTELLSQGPALVVGRHFHSGVLLRDGSVLLLGGKSSGTQREASTERFSPSTGQVVAGPQMKSSRERQTATLLEDGRVLVVGDFDGTSNRVTELFVDGGFVLTGSPSVSRGEHVAVRLLDGRVVAIGGRDGTSTFWKTGEVYEPVSGTWSALSGALATGVAESAACLAADGTLVTLGGNDGNVATAQVTTVAAGANALAAATPMPVRRDVPNLVSLPDGRLLVAGGTGGSDDTQLLVRTLSGGWQDAGHLPQSQSGGTLTVLADGTVLLAGGFEAYPTPLSARLQLISPHEPFWSSAPQLFQSWRDGALLVAVDGHAYLFGGAPDGRAVSRLEASAWVDGGRLLADHADHPTATLLLDGRVLIVGGVGATSEVFDPATGRSTATGPMAHPRTGHAAVLLGTGEVLVAGGTGPGFISQAERFHPGTLSFTPAASVNVTRTGGQLTLSRDGRAWLGAGATQVERYDPARDAWDVVATLGSAHQQGAVLLESDDAVTIAGGVGTATADRVRVDGGIDVSRALLGTVPVARSYLLRDRWMLAHANPDGGPATAELLTPQGPALALPDLPFRSSGAVSAMAADGRPLVVSTSPAQGDSAWFDEGRNTLGSLVPNLVSAPAVWRPGDAVTLTGSGFSRGEGARGAYNSSSSEVPLVRLERLGDPASEYLPVRNWGQFAVTVDVPKGQLPGWYSVRVIARGSPSQPQLVRVRLRTGGPCVEGVVCESGQCVAGVCGDGGVTDGGVNDGGLIDGGLNDGGINDGGLIDGGLIDGGLIDGGLIDGGLIDGGLVDGGLIDGGLTDGGLTDGGLTDGGLTDGGVTDGGTPGGPPSSLQVGCGCGQAGGAVWILALMFLRGRRRARHLAD
ncbi:MAG: hypothetical protein K1X89_05070 [Myxococcaceae bacterium]|nr:hypothetical protein [Myxococcaceae bacterium]